MCAGFDTLNGSEHPRQFFHPACELKREQFAEERADADAREEIAALADLPFCLAVITVLWVVKRALHKFSEGNRAAVLNLLAQTIGERIHQRDTSLLPAPREAGNDARRRF